MRGRGGKRAGLVASPVATARSMGPGPYTLGGGGALAVAGRECTTARVKHPPFHGACLRPVGEPLLGAPSGLPPLLPPLPTPAGGCSLSRGGVGSR